MDATATTVDLGPDWLTAEMPPGYRNRMAEVQRLLAELREMGRLSRLLCEVGEPLRDLLQDVFVSLKFPTEAIDDLDAPALAVRLDGGRRILMSVALEDDPIEKRSREIACLFQLLHERAEDADRVTLVTNVDSASPPASRRAAVTADALAFLQRMGGTHVGGPALFDIWKLSLQEPARAREQVQRLYAQESGSFVPLV